MRVLGAMTAIALVLAPVAGVASELKPQLVKASVPEAGGIAQSETGLLGFAALTPQVVAFAAVASLGLAALISAAASGGSSVVAIEIGGEIIDVELTPEDAQEIIDIVEEEQAIVPPAVSTTPPTGSTISTTSTTSTN